MRSAPKAMIMVIVNLQAWIIICMKRTDGETCPVHFQTVEMHHILHQQSAPKLLIDIIQYHPPFSVYGKGLPVTLAKYSSDRRRPCCRIIPLSQVTSNPGCFFRWFVLIAKDSTFCTNESCISNAKGNTIPKIFAAQKKSDTF